jgi:hypothetical protein
VAGAGTLQDFYSVGPAVARRGRRQSVTFVAFDLLWHDGELLTGRPYSERRELLDGLDLGDLGVPTVPSLDGEDAALLFAACDALGVEGVVLKRRASLYWPGTRSRDWLKAKVRAWREHMERRVPTRPGCAKFSSEFSSPSSAFGRRVGTWATPRRGTVGYRVSDLRLSTCATWDSRADELNGLSSRATPGSSLP